MVYKVSLLLFSLLKRCCSKLFSIVKRPTITLTTNPYFTFDTSTAKCDGNVLPNKKISNFLPTGKFC